jgi:UPF0755 protein
MDHLGSGKAWDLSRKNDGLYILPPYGASDESYSGRVASLAGMEAFFSNSKEEYVVMSDCHVVANIDYSYAESKNLTEYDVLILASIVERESASDVRAEVSSVFYNRLSGGMQLQSDATTAYLVNGDPTPEDLENTAENPYNTQYNYGLPPGPICSPSVESIEAAAHPADTNYLYFFFQEDSSGKMQYYFSENYDDHLAAIEGNGTPITFDNESSSSSASAASSAGSGSSSSSSAAADNGGGDAAAAGEGASEEYYEG